MRKFLFLSFLITLFEIATTQAQERNHGPAQAGTPNIEAQQKLNQVSKQFFIENKGQWPGEVLYLTQSAGLNTWITTKGMWYEFYKTEEIEPVDKLLRNEFVMPDKFEHAATKRWGHRVGYTLIGNNKTVQTQGKQKQEGYYNYLIGNDPSKHASNVGLYKEAIVKEVYEGIDMRYYFDKGNLRYDYVVKPGADPGQIKFKFEGSESSYLNEKGELVFTTCFGEVKNVDLFCYQQHDKLPKGKPVTAQFTKQGENWTFNLGNYDKSKTLTIDPLIYSTYLGGMGEEIGFSIAVDATANAYITGETSSINYDTSPGAFQTTYAGGAFDIFVTKLSASGSALIYSTYIGGSGADYCYSIALDASNNAYIAGETASANFDIIPGAFQTTLAGSYDVFVTMLQERR